MSTTTSGHAFPSHNLDPREKVANNGEWILKFIKAMWGESSNRLGKSLYFGQDRYSEIRAYAMGRQSTDQYKKLLTGETQADKSWATINWNPLALLPKYREIAISKILQRGYDLQCYAVDPLSKSEEDAKFNEMKVKILMREEAKKMDSELADNPMLRPGEDEPEDMEQLKMQAEFGFKSKFAMEIEMGIQYCDQYNNKPELRKRTVECLVDYGIGGYTQWLDENGVVKERDINPKNLVLSPCQKNDFSDLTYWGEVMLVPLADLVPYFDPAQLKKIGDCYAGKHGNPVNFNANAGGWYDPFKVLVLDAKFLSWDEDVWKLEPEDSRGNERFGKTRYENKQFIENIEADYGDDRPQGAATPVYSTSSTKVVYKGKWIIDSEYIYDWGLSDNMSRKPSSWWDTNLDIQLYAWSFDNMTFTGLTERLIPLEDKACQIWYKMQNLSNKLVPYLIKLDLSALEGVSYGKGGAANKPEDITDFIFNNFTVLYRSLDLMTGNMQPIDPVKIEATGQLAVFGQYREELISTIEMMRQVSGLNDATDGSTVGQKTLNGATAAMVESTNNALYLIQKADTSLVVAAGDNTIQKIQCAVKLGKISGYLKGLGAETVKFFEISPDVQYREFGLYLQEAPTDMQREALWQDLNIKESQGLLDVTDKFLIMSCRNLKQAMMLLGYKIKQRQEQMHQMELQKIEQNNATQAEAAIAVEQAKTQAYQIQLQGDIQKIIIEKKMEYEIESMKKSMDLQGELAQAQGRLDVGSIAAEAKVISSQIAAQATIDAAKLKPKPKPAGKKK